MANNNDDDQKQIAELINFTVESAAAQLESKITNDLESKIRSIIIINNKIIIIIIILEQKPIYLQEETTTNDEDIAISTVSESVTESDTDTDRNEPFLNNNNKCEQFTDVRLSMNDSKKEDVIKIYLLFVAHIKL
jgi:hypothetical protein